MPSLVIQNGTDVLDLDSVLKTGRGVQVTSGVAGLGLPPVSVQWTEGAGDGASYRGRRVTARDIDLPLMVVGKDRLDLKDWVRRLTMMLAGTCTLTFVDDEGEAWSADVVRVGGGTYTYGTDTTGELDLFTVVTVRAGDPYWTGATQYTQSIKKTTGRGLLPKLAALKLTSDRALGQFSLDNPGSVGAYPMWIVKGPGTAFTAVSPTGETLAWSGNLASTDTLTIDTRAGTVTDQTGANRYAGLAPAPRFWQLPPGANTVSVALDNSTVDSIVTMTWRPRRWVVI